MSAVPSFKRGSGPGRIRFDSRKPYSTAGGFGIIFRGVLHPKSSQDGPTVQSSPVALKQARGGADDDDTVLGSIIKETSIWMDLKHPNILQFLGLLYDRHDTYLVSPFAPHGTVIQYLTSNPSADRRNFLSHIAAGIAYLHRRKLIHGDIKGANVLVFEGPIAKICDFGLSKFVGGNQSSTGQGTSYWMSPERLLGKSTRSRRSDVYAFGITIYEILSGKTPFHPYSFPGLVLAVCERGERPPQLPEFSASGVSYRSLWRLAAQCWEENHLKRPLMKDVLTSIESAVDAEDDFRDIFVPSVSLKSSGTVVRTQSRSNGRSHAADSLCTTPSGHPVSGAGTEGVARSNRSGQQSKPRSENNLRLVDLLPHAKSASHRSARPSGSKSCLEGTRTAVLKTLYEWAESTDPSTPRVFWLNGMAGTGKSAIAQTLAEYADEEGILGASFFFSLHGEVEVRDGSLAIPTIAFQLAHSVPSFERKLALALKRDPDAASYTPQRQRKTLLDGPLKEIKGEKPIVVVLDALDECDDGDVIEVLEVLLEMMSSPAAPPALKLFLTSRPDRDIDSVFQQASLHQTFLLHDIEQDIVQADIDRYLRNGLTNSPSAQLPSNWISEADIKELVRRSGKLFVYATTTLNFIMEQGLESPQDQLRSVLGAEHGKDDYEMSNLDGLYLRVLQSAVTRRRSKSSEKAVRGMVDHTQMILGTLVLLRTPLSVSTIRDLITLPSDRINTVLANLRSVIVLPTALDQPPSFLHQSFADFIIAPDRCSDPRFCINVPKHERQLAVRCLNVMQTLLERKMWSAGPDSTESSDDEDADDMNTEDEYSSDSAEDDDTSDDNTEDDNTEDDDRGSEDAASEAVPNVTKTYGRITPELAYACCHWASHLAVAPVRDEELLDQLQDFVGRCLLWWLEVLSVTGQLAKAPHAADAASKWAVESKASDETISLLRDVHRFILAHMQTIDDDPDHIYFSALPFVPRNTSLWENYQHEAEESIRVVSGAPEDWLPCLGVLEGHSDAVTTIVFSRDGSHLASASSDNTVRIWDVISSRLIVTLQGHSEPVDAIAFSPDGSRIASGSDDKTLRIWDAVSGETIFKLEGHSKWVNAVAFSPDGSRIASGSGDRTVRTWDAVSGRLTATMKGHSGSVTLIEFSLCGKRIASGSDDHCVRMWSATSSRWIATLQGHTERITAITFSPDGRQIVSGSEDCTVRIWDAASGKSLFLLEGHRGGVTTVAFLPGWDYIASGSEDRTIRFWEVTSGEHVSTLRGHSQAVQTIAFTPDGRRIVSGSDDSTIRIWDAIDDHPIAALPGHTDRISKIAVSSDASRIASASKDGTVRIWDALAGESAATPQGTSTQVHKIEFSSDGLRVASCSSDDTIRIWDTISGLPTAVVEDVIPEQIALSSDGSRMLCGFDDGTLGMWDAETAEHLISWQGHSSSVTAIAFSPDGSWIASVSESDTIRLWDGLSGEHIAWYQSRTDCVETIRFSRIGPRVLARCEDGTLLALTIGSSLSLVRGPLSSKDVLDLTFGSPKRGDDVGPEVFRRWIDHLDVPFDKEFDSGIECAAVSPDWRMAAVGCTNGGFFILQGPCGP